MLANWYTRELLYRFLYCFFCFCICFIICFVYRESLLFLFLEPYRVFFGGESLVILRVKELLVWELALCFFASFWVTHVTLLVSLFYFMIPSLFLVEFKALLFYVVSYILLFIAYCFHSFHMITLLMTWWYSFGYPELYGFAIQFSTSLSLESYLSFFIEFFVAIWILACLLFVFSVLFFRIRTVAGFYKMRVLFYSFVFGIIFFILPADFALHLCVGGTFVLFFELFLFLFILVAKVGEVA